MLLLRAAVGNVVKDVGREAAQRMPRTRRIVFERWSVAKRTAVEGARRKARDCGVHAVLCGEQSDLLAAPLQALEQGLLVVVPWNQDRMQGESGVTKLEIVGCMRYCAVKRGICGRIFGGAEKGTARSCALESR